MLVGELFCNIPRCIVTEREGEAVGHLYCNTPKCIVTGGQCIVTQYTVSESPFGHCSCTLFTNTVHEHCSRTLFTNTVHKIF